MRYRDFRGTRRVRYEDSAVVAPKFKEKFQDLFLPGKNLDRVTVKERRHMVGHPVAVSGSGRQLHQPQVVSGFPGD